MSNGRAEQIALIERLIKKLQLLLQKLRRTRSRSDLLAEHARLAIGKDASPLDFVTDELGCAESVTNLINKVTPFPIILGTWTLWDKLRKDTRFVEVRGVAPPGTIIISPTGTGNGRIRGHVGIMLDGERIMSATSRDGIWRQNYTVQSWTRRFHDIGAFPTFFYRLV